MFRPIFTSFLIVLFLQVLLISAQNNTATNSQTNQPVNVQVSPTVSPTNTVASTPPPSNTATTPQTTVTPPKTESPIIKIPSENGEAEITFLGTNETDKNKLTLKVSYKDERGSTPQKKTFLVSNTELKSLLGKFKEGDKVLLEYTKEKDGDMLKDIEVKSVATNPLLALLPILGFPILGVFGFGIGYKLILGEDGLYSKSKFQIVLWFFVLIGVYVAVNILRVVSSGDWSFVGGIGIPTNLLLLTGLSSLTFVGAKAIIGTKTESKPQMENKDFLKDIFYGDPKYKTGTDGKPILTTDGKGEEVGERKLDLGDFQMIIITLLAVGVYIVQAISFTGNIELHQFITLPDVDSTILAAFGLGQGAYLVKKYATEAG